MAVRAPVKVGSKAHLWGGNSRRENFVTDYNAKVTPSHLSEMFRDFHGQRVGLLSHSHGCPPCEIVGPPPQQKRTNFPCWTSIPLPRNNGPFPEDVCHPNTACDRLLPGSTIPADILRPAGSFHMHSLLLLHFLLYVWLHGKELVQSSTQSRAHWQSPTVASQRCFCILTHRYFLRAMDMCGLSKRWVLNLTEMKAGFQAAV